MERKLPKLAKWLSSALILILILLTVTIAFSPYRHSPDFAYKLIQHSIEIEAPVDTVFKFLGKSANASGWSVFVDHITPLNTNKIADGSLGSQRRCFCNKDENGRRWDELITIVIPCKKRQLTIYNLVEFPISAKNLATEQIYEKLNSNKCRVTFTLFFSESPGVMDGLKMHIASYEIKKIFSENMHNIKKIIEINQSPTIL